MTANGIYKPKSKIMREFLAADPLTPPMRIFFERQDVSRIAVCIYASVFPEVEDYGWVDVYQVVKSEQVVKRFYGAVYWGEVD